MSRTLSIGIFVPGVENTWQEKEQFEKAKKFITNLIKTETAKIDKINETLNGLRGGEKPQQLEEISQTAPTEIIMETLKIF
jgi:hypothetical protein